MSPYKRRVYYRGAKKHYSVEQSAGTATTTSGTGDAAIAVVPSVTAQGKRKVKHVTVSMGHNSTSSSLGQLLYWALVYQPEGTSVNPLQYSSTSPGISLYEPSQYVMDCGVFDFDGGPLRIHSRVSRILNSGDQIVLVIKSRDASGPQIYSYIVRYAVAYD